MRKRNPTLYLIGGLARTGKSKVMRVVLRHRCVAAVSSDIIRAAIRKALTGESYVAIHDGRLRGEATFHRPGSLKEYHLTVSKNHWNEDELAWQGVLGIIETHDLRKIDLLVEGVVITPKRVHGLHLKNLRVRAVFLGYEHESHLKSMLAYSKQKNDWLQRVIKEHGSDAPVKQGFSRGLAKSAKLRQRARRFGYGYFDVSKPQFRAQINAAAMYLTKRGR